VVERIKIRVLLGDHHAPDCDKVKRLLDEIGGIEVVAEANDGGEVIDLIGKCRPQLVLMEIALPHLNGEEVIRLIVREHPDVRVLIVSMHVGEEDVLRALRAGASGYLHKNAAAGEFQLAINTVARAEIFFSPAISRNVVEAYLSGTRQPSGAPNAA
jgi:DNA-binding NarL/FixJ family response regulator